MPVSEKAVMAAAVAYNKTGPFASHNHGIRTALTAAAPFQQGVKVKKLEWKTERADKMNGVDTERTGFHEFGYYSITGQKGCYYVSTFDNMGRMRHVGHHGFASIEAAKAAAQADFEARILSALEPSAARDLALEELVRAATSSFNAIQHYAEINDTTVAVSKHLNTALEAAIRSLSSPDHIADAGKLVEGDGWKPGCDRLPTLQEAAFAAKVLNACNGYDLSVWSDDFLPNSDTEDGLRAIIAHSLLPYAPASEDAE